MRKLIFAVPSLTLILGGCAWFQANAPQIFTDACTGLVAANSAFQSGSPALISAGKLTQAQVTQEQAIFAVAQHQCQTPPVEVNSATGQPILDANGNPIIDYVGLATQITADAAAIYMIIAQPSAATPAAAAVLRR